MFDENSKFFIGDDGKIIVTKRHTTSIPHDDGKWKPLYENDDDKYNASPYDKLTIVANAEIEIYRSIEREDAFCNSQIFTKQFTLLQPPSYYYPLYNNSEDSGWSKSGNNYVQTTTVKDANGTLVGHIFRSMSLDGFFKNESFYEDFTIDEHRVRTKGNPCTDISQQNGYFDYSRISKGSSGTYYGKVTFEITTDFEFFYEALFHNALKTCFVPLTGDPYVEWTIDTSETKLS